MKYSLYQKQHKNETRTLNVFDVDDTLGVTAAKVHVNKDGKRIKSLDAKEYNHYKLGHGESYDYSDLRSDKIFRDTFKPIANVLDRAKSIIWNQTENSHSIILTARADFADKEEFLQAFRDHGFPIDHAYVERAGNLNNLKKSSPPHINKGVILKKYMASGKFDRVRMWDDSVKNLDTLMKVAEAYPKIEVIAYLVKDGKVSRYKSNRDKTVTEEVISVAKSFRQRQLYD